MDNIIYRLTEYEKDIKLLKDAILVLEKNFKKIKSDIVNNCEKTDKKKKPLKKNKKQQSYIIFEKSSIILSDNNNIKDIFNINYDSGNKLLISELNKKINEYLIKKDLIKDNKVCLNKELKTLLKINNKSIALDKILNSIIKINK